MTACFMVKNTLDCWFEGGGQRVGAMVWRYHEFEKYDTDPRPLPHLGVMTQAGLACLDCPDTSEPHGKWTREGIPPMVTVTPSLNISEGQPTAWHGYLTAGVLSP